MLDSLTTGHEQRTGRAWALEVETGLPGKAATELGDRPGRDRPEGP